MDTMLVSTNTKRAILTSMEVAEMAEKMHKNLLRDIAGYIEALGNSTKLNFEPSSFFIESTYQDSTGRTLPCYLITRKGCDFIANKLTGEKGIQFTAAYVTKFHQMETKALPNSIEDLIIMQATSMKELREKVERHGETLAAVQVALTPVRNDWRRSAAEMFNGIVEKTPDKDYQAVRHESYETLERRAKCSLSARVRNMKKRLEMSGATLSTINKVYKIDAIEADARLREIYVAILREMAVRLT